jgi:O-antigen ligase
VGRYNSYKKAWTSSPYESCAEAVLIGVVFFAFSPAGYSDRLHSISDTSKDETGSANARWAGMVGAAQISLQHPFGAGLRMHHILLNDRSTGVHSAFLQVAADLGIVGGILFAVIFARLILAMQDIRNSSVSDLNVKPLAEAAEVSLVAFGVSGMFLPSAYVAPYYVLVGIAIAIKQVAARAPVDDNEGGQRGRQGVVYAMQPIGRGF